MRMQLGLRWHADVWQWRVVGLVLTCAVQALVLITQWFRARPTPLARLRAPACRDTLGLCRLAVAHGWGRVDVLD